ncbi:MAG: helix-turn-helix domain-containing protein [Okeania sp. SIO2G4]|nr:helix-turn-helix domain-containing protein [Okeania sp. SIO4D6]NEP70646.1 helix-turn-helix domain-containing protein [Okeania sp. SIO2G5]NEP91890.1 helix-turn-helix domain-containing protein [Okeania sp. SIO2F5]NEQ89314.1 helix-turn-helix domain-containing protein [Okeania sp. SIO2G4]
MCAQGTQAQKKWTDREISSGLNVHTNTVGRIRQRFLEEGIGLSLNRRTPLSPPNPH